MPDTNSTCTVCNAEFFCSTDLPGSCWCAALPAVVPVGAGAACMCPDCLTSNIEARFREEPVLAKPFIDNALKKRPPLQFQQGLDYYKDRGGRWVFTAYYHLRKGYCCQLGCKHCPYGKSNTAL